MDIQGLIVLKGWLYLWIGSIQGLVVFKDWYLAYTQGSVVFMELHVFTKSGCIQPSFCFEGVCIQGLV